MGKLIPVCQVGDLQDGESIVVTVDGRNVAVFFSAGQYYAINDACPHAGSPLSDGHVEDGVVTCSWHGWRFRLADGAWADNPRVKTACYPVQLDGTQVSVVGS